MQSGTQEGIGSVAKLDPVLCGGRGNGLSFLDGQRKRLLAVDVLARADRLERDTGMDRRNCQVHYQFDLWHGQNGFKIAGTRNPVFGRLRRGTVHINVRTSQYGDIGKADKVGQVLVANITAADNDDSDGFKGIAHDISLVRCQRARLPVEVKGLSAELF